MADILGLKRGTVRLLPYQKEWGGAFEEEKENLEKLLRDVVVDIQHVGSTAIPGLSAKPIIDMLMAVSSLSVIQKIRDTLEGAGYQYRENGSDEVQVLFVKGSEENRTHYLHITELGSQEWKNSLAFRDYLRAHPEEVERYESLKQKLAKLYPNDRREYTKAKKDFFERIFEKARDERLS